MDSQYDSGSESDEFGDNNKKDQRKDLKKKAYKGDSDDCAEFDADMAAIFNKVPPGEGDEAGAVNPAKGAIKEPVPKPKNNKQEPEQQYGMDWVYGYRSEEARNNAAFNSKGQAVYPTAAIGVVFDYENMKQVWFGGGKTDFGGRKQEDESKEIHTDDITACCVSFDRKSVATGQNGQKPLICIWDAETAEFECQKRMPKGSRLVTAICFSGTGKYIAASDAAEKICVHIFERKGKKSAIATCSINMKIVHLSWCPHNDTDLASAGSKHFCHIGFDGGKSAKKTAASSQKTNNTNMCSIAWMKDPKYKGHCVSGGSDGKLYHLKLSDVQSNIKNGKGSVHSVCTVNDSKVGGECILVGGNDKTLNCFQFDGKLPKSPLWTIQTDSAPRSIDSFNGNLLLGYKNGSLTVLPFTKDGKASPQVVMTSHCDGEVWGLQVIDISANERGKQGKGDLRAITSADDNRVLTYNIKKHLSLAEGQVKEPPKKKKKAKKGFKGGASSMSSEPSDQQSRSVAYNYKHKHLAVANNIGEVTIRLVDWKKVDAGDPEGLNTEILKKPLFYDKDGKKRYEWIEAMAYSPNGDYLAVGSHDNYIYILDVEKDYKLHGKKMTGHSSFITALDWSQDSSQMRSTCGAHELLFWNPQQKSKQRDPKGASNTTETKWQDHKAKLGWCVEGITPSGCDGTHINSVALSANQSLIATGDDYGLLCVYRNPARAGNEYSKYRGHSEFVTNVAWAEEDKWLFSAGGQDQTCIQWKKL